MLVFVDEAGDTGSKLDKGSSRYFIVTLVLFEENEEAEAADTRINLLRRDLSLAADFEFTLMRRRRGSKRRSLMQSFAITSFTSPL